MVQFQFKFYVYATTWYWSVLLFDSFSSEKNTTNTMHGPSVAKVIPYSDALPMDANAKLSKEGIKELRFVMYNAF